MGVGFLARETTALVGNAIFNVLFALHFHVLFFFSVSHLSLVLSKLFF